MHFFLLQSSEGFSSIIKTIKYLLNYKIYIELPQLVAHNYFQGYI